MPRSRLLALLLSALLLGCAETPSADPATEEGGDTTATSQGAAEGDGTAASNSEVSAEDVEVKLISIEETQNLIASHKGKVVVLDCWSTYCEPCIKEFPGLVALHKKYPDQVACMSLSLDYYGGKKKPEEFKPMVLEFLQGQGATFENVLCTDPEEEVRKVLEFDAPPAVFVFNQQGQQVHKFVHDGTEPPFTYADVEKQVAELLAKKDGADSTTGE